MPAEHMSATVLLIVKNDGAFQAIAQYHQRVVGIRGGRGCLTGWLFISNHRSLMRQGF